MTCSNATTNVRVALIKWYEQHGRSFLWRENTDPFVVLVAEILLKKTTARMVSDFIARFLKRYPDTSTLAEANLDELASTLGPLGLSKQRAEQFKSLGMTLENHYGGQIPANKNDLLELPGVGDYTAGAVMSFAFGKPEAIVDTNVARVLVRIYGITPSRYEARRSPEIWSQAVKLVGKEGRSACKVNWALLDLGALVCRPRTPKCNQCPLAGFCKYAS